jgi:hypothetical protein
LASPPSACGSGNPVRLPPRASMLERYFAAMSMGKREAWKVIEAN